MGDAGDEFVVARLGRADRLAHRAHQSVGHAGGAHASLPVRPVVPRERFVEEGEQALPMPDAQGTRGVIRIGGHVRTFQHLPHEPLEDSVVAAVDVEGAVAGAEGARGAGVGGGVAAALRLLAGEQRLHGRIARHQDGRVEQGHLHPLAAAQALPGQQRAEHGVAHHHGGADVHHRRERPHAFAVGITVHGNEAAFGLRDGIEAEAVGEGAFAAVGGHRAVDQARVQGKAGLVVQPQATHHARGEVLDQHVGAADEVARQRQPLRGLQVQRDALLVAVAPDEGCALVQLRVHGRIAARVVAADRRLDLDHLGAHVGQDHGRQRPRDEVREVHHPDAVQRMGCAGGPSLVLRKVGFEVLQHVLAACLHRRTAHGVYPKPLPSSAFM